METVKQYIGIVMACGLWALALTGTSLQAQNDTIYYNARWRPTEKDSAAFFRPPLIKQGERYKALDFYVSGALQMEGYTTSPERDIWDGTVKWYNEDGSLLRQSGYKQGKLHGTYISFLNGKRLKAEFQNGKLVSGKTHGRLNAYNYLTEIRGDTIVNTIYDKALDGIRYERFSVGDQYDVLTKYYDLEGKLIGTKERLPDGSEKGISVSYYQNPMEVMGIRHYIRGREMGQSFYFCGGQARELFTAEPSPKKRFFDTTGTLLGTMEYGYGNGYLKPLTGTEYTYFSSYDTYRGSLVREIRKYDNAKLIYKKRFYENQNPQNEVLYDSGGTTLEEISYNENGKEIGRLAYRNAQPFEGSSYGEDSKRTYADGVLVQEKIYYRESDRVFSALEGSQQHFYDTEGTLLGSLVVEVNGGYIKPIEGVKYTKGYEGNITTIEAYSNGKLQKRVSFRNRQLSDTQTKTYKHEVFYGPDGFKKQREKRYYGNGNLQSDISFSGYKEVKGLFYDQEGALLGEYDYEAKNGTLYRFFTDSDEVERMEVLDNGKQLRLKRYTYGPESKYGNINPILIMDADVDCCASFWDNQGKLLGKVTFKEGIPWDGTLVDIDQRTKYSIVQGKRNGVYEKYSYRGTPLEKGNYSDDMRSGTFTYYDHLGKPTLEEQYKEDVLHGTATFYDTTGKIQGRMEYREGKPYDGKRFKGAYGNRTGRDSETYSNGLIVQEVSYDENGKRVTAYSEGKPLRTLAYHGETDKKRMEYTKDKSGFLDGVVKRYDEEGKLMHEAVFENGRLKKGTVLLFAESINGRPEYMRLEVLGEKLKVVFYGLAGKELFKAEEALAFGAETVFLRSLGIYLDRIYANNLY